ncbi:beta-lactamase/transpeptidase-like protein [Diplogelasinospora grovesii]|uniref:Beta-lactamase/transpeptidase-like protein n=1 Tax=Diplogelasinospora grovesii TaxID=303347 RepID=A0AAN6MU98_9PEZI|nr:beta-lactamase/transpeptidase-like protein [Diplogelasinospora grovesii]
MDPKELLSNCRAIFEESIKKFGNGGASLGILKDGKSDYLELGTETTMPNENTVHLTSSMTKSILAVAIGMLVSSGKIRLDTPVKDIIQLRATCNHRSGAPLRVVDLLDHRSEFFSEPDFRNTRNYSNLGYALLAMIIEEKAGMSWTEFLHTKVFDPLGMTRSTADMSCRKPEGNIADSYCAQINGQELRDLLGDDEDSAAVHERFLCRVKASNLVAVAQPLQLSKCSDTATYIGAAAGIRSTVSDLLKFYQACIELFNERPDRELTEFEAGAIVVLDHIREMAQDRTCAYAGGWNPVSLPWDQKQRAPGADGENYGRLRAVADLNTSGRSSMGMLTNWVDSWHGSTAVTWLELLRLSSSSPRCAWLWWLCAVQGASMSTVRT